MGIEHKLGKDVKNGDVIMFVGGIIIGVYDNCGGFILGKLGGLPVKFNYSQSDTFPVMC